MRIASTVEDLALHGTRCLGFATASRVARRYRLEDGLVEEALGDFEARGWVRHSAFAGSEGWSLTDTGRVEDERRMAAELDRTGLREVVERAHEAFLPLNDRFTAACTHWQVRPTRLDPMAPNDHTDFRWDDRVLDTLSSVQRSFGGVCGMLTEHLVRFDPYPGLYAAALREVSAGRRAWVDASDRDSVHLVWMQFHEDLRATLGLDGDRDT